MKMSRERYTFSTSQSCSASDYASKPTICLLRNGHLHTETSSAKNGTFAFFFLSFLCQKFDQLDTTATSSLGFGINLLHSFPESAVMPPFYPNFTTFRVKQQKLCRRMLCIGGHWQLANIPCKNTNVYTRITAHIRTLVYAE